VVKFGILGAICLLAFGIRLFAVVRYESVIHEFDPYFNFRTTKVSPYQYTTHDIKSFYRRHVVIPLSFFLLPFIFPLPPPPSTWPRKVFWSSWIGLMIVGGIHWVVSLVGPFTLA